MARPLAAGAVVATVLALLAPAPAAGARAGAGVSPAQTRSGQGDPGLTGTGLRGTGLLPNFAAKGSHLIRLQAGAFDPLANPAPAQGALPHVSESALREGRAQYWLLQVADGRFADASAAVRSTGALVASAVPDNTYLVRATPAQRRQIAANPAVRWMGYYQPAWRVPSPVAGKPGLLDLSGSQVYRVYAFRADPDPGS
ncbi:MAG: hypothetical protein LC749_14550, partial [Actinobacteria bacterium]|nr:hypothetical protein [Actinomycetota bacterium]